MESDKNDYHISFFKPTTDSARRNRNMIVQLVLIWAVAIFGFQILLKILEKPVPEQAFIDYESYWEDIKQGDTSSDKMIVVAQSGLSVLGKGGIAPGHRIALDNAVSWIAWSLADSTQKHVLQSAVSEFEDLAAAAENITDEKYIQGKNALIPVLSDIFSLNPGDIRSKIAPLEVKTSMMESFSDENKEMFEEAMKLYLIHKQSVLTDTKFLGFPFHYFYTAVFLLILFVGLCWLYCVRTDLFNKKYGIED